MDIKISSKLPGVGTTIFTTMSALATRHQAINLGQGFPDFPMNELLAQKVTQAMQDGFNQYMPMQGYLPLREVLAEKAHSLYQAAIDPGSDITITPGGTYAIYTALTAILQPGDEVIVFEPAYDSYIPNIEINGAIPVRISLPFPDYRVNWAEVKEKLSPRTRAIIINSPHNPTGSVLLEEDMEQLQELLKDTGIIIISDEVYEHLVFDGIEHQSVLRYPALAQRSFACFSFGKVYHCTGWKLGYCISPAPLMTEFRKVHQFNCFSCHSPSQVALSSFLQDKDSYLSLGAFLQQKRDHFASLMQQTRFEPLPSFGSYFQLYKYDRISEEKDTEFCTRLTRDHGVAAIPVSAFYSEQTDNKVIRFCFAKKESTLSEAAGRLARL